MGIGPVCSYCNHPAKNHMQVVYVAGHDSTRGCGLCDCKALTFSQLAPVMAVEVDQPEIIFDWTKRRKKYYVFPSHNRGYGVACYTYLGAYIRAIGMMLDGALGVKIEKGSYK